MALQWRTADMASTALPGRVAATPRARLSISRTAYLLFLVFVFYLVIPVIDVPLLGLSLSAPILFLVFLEVFLNSRSLRLGGYGRWLAISYAFLVGLLLSLAGNAIFRGLTVETRDILTLVRYGYWLIAFITTLIVVSSLDSLRPMGFVIAGGILLVAGLRLFEAVFYGRWGAWTGPQLMTQNSYGFQFSSFFPFALALPFVLHGLARRLASIGLILAVAAIAGNGSRSSWITVTTATAVFLLLYALTQRKGLLRVQSWLIVMVGLLIMLVALAPPELLDPINERFSTFNTLEEDKSYAIRGLMVQKGQRMFQESPLYGAGIGRFARTSVQLDIPNVLRYAGQEHFNVKSPHNSYIALLGETGLAGTVPFLILHILLFAGGFSAAIGLARRGEIWAIAAFAGYVGMSIHLWTLAGLTGTGTWFVYGLVAGMIERNKRFAEPAAP